MSKRKKNLDPEFSDVYSFGFGKFFLIILVLGILGGIGYFVYEKKYYNYVIEYFKLDKKPTVLEDEDDDTRKLIYYYSQDDKIISSSIEISDLELKSTYACKSNSCESVLIDGNFAVISDEDNFIYSINNMTLDVIDVDLNKIDGDYYIISHNDVLYGLLYRTDKLRYYSINDNKVVYNSATWNFDEHSNLCEYGYISLFTKSSGALLDLNTNKIVESSIVDGKYEYYDNHLVINNDGLYKFLDEKLKPINSKYMFVRNSKDNDVYYLTNSTKAYTKCDMKKNKCTENKMEFTVLDVLNNKLIVLKNNKLYFASTGGTLGSQLIDMKELEYIQDRSFYLNEDKDDLKEGLYLSFHVNDDTCNYVRYYFGTSNEVISKETIK